MARRPSGSIRQRGTSWTARIMVEPGTRVEIPLPTCHGEDAARQRAELLNSLAERLRRSGHAELAKKYLQMAADRDGRDLDAVLRSIDDVCTGRVVMMRAPSKDETVESLAKRWTSGELARLYPDYITPKQSEEDAYRIEKWILPVVRRVRVVDFELHHAEEVMRGLPGHDERGGSRASRRHVAQIMHRMFKMAVYPLKLITANPIPPGWLPKLGDPKAHGFLYPDEDRALLGCHDIPIGYRLLYGFLDREGMRRSEAYDLQFVEVDIARGGVRLDENKTNDPRQWALDKGTALAISAWKALREGHGETIEPGSYVFVDGGQKLTDQHLADRFRDHLRTAGVTRAELFERTRTRDPINAHGLRRTFVILALANGKTETWVADRTGHRSSEQIFTYRRSARQVEDMNLGPLAPLIDAIPELGSEPGRIVSIASRRRQ